MKIVSRLCGIVSDCVFVFADQIKRTQAWGHEALLALEVRADYAASYYFLKMCLWCSV